MLELATTADVFDNSGPGPVTLAPFVGGEPVGAPRWPSWLPVELTDHWNR